MQKERHDRRAEHARHALKNLASVLGSEQSAMAKFAAAELTAKEAIGHRLFTIMAFHADSVEVERLYSSNQEAYPPGGRKQKRDTAWGQQVLERGEPYIGSTAHDIRANFNDHEVILGLGLESVLNVPIKFEGQTIGTMNLLHDENYYDISHLAVATEIATILAETLVGVMEND